MKKSTRVQKLAKAAEHNAFALAGLAAKGREDAAIALYQTAASTTEWLTYLCQKNPAQFSAIARNKFSWPVMYSPHPESMKEDVEFIKKIKLATNTGINLSSGKSFSWNNAANVVAFNLYRLAQSLRRSPIESFTDSELTAIAACGVGRRFSGKVEIHSTKYEKASIHAYDAKYEKQLKELKAWGQRDEIRGLPPLSKQAASQWWPAIKRLFEIAYPRDFMQHPKLQELRIQVLGRAWKGDSWAGDKKPGGPGIIRASMLRAVKQALSSIAVTGK